MRRETDARIEQTRVPEARLAAELLGARDARPAPRDGLAELDAEADRIGDLVGARVTFIAADGRVLGDSAETLEGIAAMENHATRPEIVAAAQTGFGSARRYSATLNIDMLYVAVPVRHADIAFVRVALPLSNIRQQLRSVLLATITALGVALAGSAGIAYLMTRRLSR